MAHIPAVAHDDDVVADSRLPEVRAALKTAATRLSGWWPEEPTPLATIFITKGPSILTASTPIFRGAAAKVRVKFGIEALESGAAKFLFGRGYGLAESATLLLAHETFHCSEMRRATECGASNESLNSGFVRGVQPGMAEPWRNLAIQLSVEYPRRNAADPQIAMASDLVSELRADIRALNAMKAIDLAWPDARADLIDLRRHDESRFGAEAYLIASQLADLAPRASAEAALLSEEKAIPILWERAADALSKVVHRDNVQDALIAARGSPFFAKPRAMKP